MLPRTGSFSYSNAPPSWTVRESKAVVHSPRLTEETRHDHAHLSSTFPPYRFERRSTMTALARASMPTESTFQGSKVDGKAMLAPVAAAPTILAWSDKAASSSVHVSPKTSYPAGQRTPSGSPRAPSPHLQAVKPQGDPPVSPRRPRRPDSIIVEDGEINAAPSYGRFPGFSQIADLGVQLEDIITTYAADPSPELAEETTEAPTTPSDPKAADTPLPADPNAAIGAALAKLGLDGPKIKASTPIVPGSERSRTLLSLRQRTLHLSSLPDYGRRIDLLQKLEVAMGAFLSIEDVEAILCMEAVSRDSVDRCRRSATDKSFTASGGGPDRTKACPAQRLSTAHWQSTLVLATKAAWVVNSCSASKGSTGSFSYSSLRRS